eukprot:216499_1
MIELIDLYCKPGRTSLVFLKSFLQYMYQQLLLLYTSQYAQNILSYTLRYKNQQKTPQFHRLIAKSLTKSAEQIACHMYQIEENKNDKDQEDETDYETDDETDDEKNEYASEATGQEEFFLVKYWAEA